ncbi:winged helix DNA-binding domain-containing protein [Saccharothrix syringae]|uniref:Winged helix DNA-binding domain-containing protein n=1 Tax=Saccharothrix syringae TaxID=103733 RepID=A0A5Q0H1Q3_SACSY|nr:winged helix DNA-binding domain-containing protein [Saccharothrix syringae]QFZ20033.1 winged helix DNA-binding domain-containing protein [Saccharothrix syringae]
MRTLTTRELNRTTLHRQLLLERADRPAADVIEHLVGMQAQEPLAPYYGLWSRTRGFRPDELVELLTGRHAVRATLHRATIHLVTAADHGRLEPLLRPFLHRRFASSPFRHAVAGVDLDEFTATAAGLLEQPRTRPELGRELAARWPDRDTAALGQAATALAPTVQVPPRGLWGRGGRARWTTAAHWLPATAPAAPVEELVRRYLAAFGPASVRDLQTWSGATRLAPVVEAMDLPRFTDPTGRVLHDLPDAPLVDPDVPAPPRFLPEFDNLLLGHHDRTRVISGEDYRRGIVVGGRPTLLVDGFVHGTWRLTPGGLRIRVLRPLDRTRRAEVEAEGAALLRFAGTDGDVAITAGD